MAQRGERQGRISRHGGIGYLEGGGLNAPSVVAVHCLRRDRTGGVSDQLAAGGSEFGQVCTHRVHEGLHGVLAIGSPDPQHYRSSLGTLFLSHVAEVLARVLPRFPVPLRTVR